MIFKEDGNNDLYEKIDVSTERKQQIIDACLKENEQRTPQIDNELDLRRNINMKNDKDGYAILKKVAVAAVSVGLSGAVIAGVVIYNGGKNNGKNVGMNKDTEVSSEMTTKSMKSTDNQENSEELKELLEKKSLMIRGLNKMSLDNDEDSNYWMIDYKVGKSKYIIGDYTIKIEGSGGVTACYLKGKEDEDFVNIPYLENIAFSLFTNGKYLYYYNEYLYKYNMETKETTYFDLREALDIDIIKYDYELVLNAVKENNIYFSVLIDAYKLEPVEPSKTSFYSLNLKNNKVNCLCADRGCERIDGDYAITAKYIDTERQNEVDQERFIEKINGNELEEIKSIGKYASVLFYQSSETNKIYFELCKKIIKSTNTDGSEVTLGDRSEITIISFDKDTCETKEECVLNSNDFYGKDEWLFIEKINDDYCVVMKNSDKLNEINGLFERDKVVRYKYVFATKEIELLSEE